MRAPVTPLIVLLAGCTAETAAPARRAPVDAAPRFAVAFDAPAAAAGKRSVAKVRVEPLGGFHMNVDFPVALDLDVPDGVDVVAGKQRKVDAERFDDDELVFAVPFTAETKGEKRFGGTVEFAVCGDEACAPQKVPVDFTVDVSCDTDAFC